MSIKSQSNNMKALAALLSSDLGYIYGEREAGPNGKKRAFLSKGRAFMSALGKDLGLSEQKVTINKAGIACSGEIYLTGLWSVDSGLYLWLEQDLAGKYAICYRTIHEKQGSKGKRKQYEHGCNCYISVATMASGDYEALLNTLLPMREPVYVRAA